MSLNTHDLVAAVALRVNALGNNDLWDATDPAGLQTVYTQRPLIDEMFGSSIFPMADIIASLIWAQGKLVEAIAFSDKRTQLAFLKSLTSPMPTNTDLPNTDNSGNPIVGNFGAVLDSESLKPLTRKSVAFVQNVLNSPNNFLVPLYYYALDGAYIQHTRDNVKLECYIYNVADQQDKYNFNEAFSLSDALAEAVICGACAQLVRDDEFMAQATQWANYFNAELANYPPMVMEQIAA